MWDFAFSFLIAFTHTHLFTHAYCTSTECLTTEPQVSQESVSEQWDEDSDTEVCGSPSGGIVNVLCTYTHTHTELNPSILCPRSGPLAPVSKHSHTLGCQATLYSTDTAGLWCRFRTCMLLIHSKVCEKHLHFSPYTWNDFSSGSDISNICILLISKSSVFRFQVLSWRTNTHTSTEAVSTLIPAISDWGK